MGSGYFYCPYAARKKISANSAPCPADAEAERLQDLASAGQGRKTLVGIFSGKIQALLEKELPSLRTNCLLSQHLWPITQFPERFPDLSK